jgi:hypothetical protein
MWVCLHKKLWSEIARLEIIENIYIGPGNKSRSLEKVHLPRGKSIAMDFFEHSAFYKQTHEDLNSVVHIFRSA